MSIIARPRTRAATLDAAFAAGLTVVAASALHGTFDGWGYLLVALAGALLGVGSAALVRLLRLPSGLVLVPLALAYLLVGPILALRGAPSGSWPGPPSAAELWRVLIGGWMDLLTTLPPIAADGRLVALVLIITMVGGALGQLLARATLRTHLPVLGPAVTLVAAILLGVAGPGGVLARALLLTLGGVVWGALRRRRLMVTGKGATTRQLATGAALLGVAAVVTTAAAPALPRSLTADSDRTILRSHVSAPVDLSDQPSPLSGFRRFRPDWQLLGEQPLLTVRGLPDAVPLRLATVDAYSGSVWAAGNAGPSGVDGAPTSRFLRVGSRIDPTLTGRSVEAQVRVEAAYAQTPDLAVWLPGTGQLTRVRFDGPQAWQHEEDLRYNPTTGAALLAGGLSTGDTYRIRAVVLDTVMPTTAGDVGQPTAPSEFASSTAKFVTTATAGKSEPVEQVKAVAERLRTTGAYTDGTGDESRFTAGHSVGRLSTFLADVEPAGNDEQYAAALALAAAQVGLPSRVSLLATPDATGVVRGRDVRAWVEVQVSPGRWWSIAPEQFMPDRDKKPTPRQDEEQDLSDTAVVPPPNATRPPSSVEQFILDSSSSARQQQTVDSRRFALPPWLVLTLQILAVPIGLFLLYVVLVVGAKRVRRMLRRRRGSPADKVAGGWADTVDRLRDLGVGVGLGQTRSEQMRMATTDLAARGRGRGSGAAEAPGAADAGVAGGAIAALARHADHLTFGPVRLDDAAAADFWQQVDRARAEIMADRGIRTRLKALLSLRSLLRPQWAADPRDMPSGRHASMVVSTAVPTGEVT